jgi:flagellar hook-associated protein 1 FlgK
MSTLSIGLSGLQVNQQLLALTGQNITNANTPGYHNEVANLAENVTDTGNVATEGSGVSITGITRNVNQILEQAIVSNNSASSSVSSQLDGLNQLQSYLGTGTGTLDDALGNLFTQLQALSTQPDDPTQRQLVLGAANDVTTQLNTTMANLNTLSSGTIAQANTDTNTINGLTSQIAQLNQQISEATAGTEAADGLMDQRDQAISSLSQLVDVQTVSQSSGQLSVLSNGAPLVLNSQAVNLSTDASSGQLVVTAGGTPLTNVSGGSLGAEVALVNNTIPAVTAQLNTFAQALATQFDQIQSTGLGLNGPMTSLTSQRTVANTNQPLAAAGLSNPPQAGNLYVTVTNLSTGQRTLNKVAIDPKTQSLASIASALNAVPNLQAVVNPQAGTLSLLAQPGYGFDFTGNVSSTPDTQAITGTTVPTIDGQYTGSGDDTLNFSFSGAGTIGVTPNLTLQVTNSAGTLVGSLNVGQGYSAGTDTSAVSGISVKLASGTVNAGDTFSVNVAGNPDSAGLLPALGLNTFFVGSTASGLEVNPQLMNNPDQLAMGTTGQPGDGSNLNKMIALQTQPILANQTQTLQQNLEGIIGNVGSQVNDATTASSAYQSLGQQLSTQQQSVSGVDPNEELMNLTQYQQSYQMSAQFISTVTQTLNYLFQLFV